MTTLQLLRFANLQVDMYKLYNDSTTSIQLENFPEFTYVVANTSCKITQDWVTDLNDDNEHLVFCIIEQSHIMHFVVVLTSKHFPITQKGVDQAVKVVKAMHYYM